MPCFGTVCGRKSRSTEGGSFGKRVDHDQIESMDSEKGESSQATFRIVRRPGLARLVPAVRFWQCELGSRSRPHFMMRWIASG